MQCMCKSYLTKICIKVYGLLIRSIQKLASQRMEEESSPSVRGGHNVKDDEDDDDDLDSRTNLFAKKRVMPLTSSLQAKKKQK